MDRPDYIQLIDDSVVPDRLGTAFRAFAQRIGRLRGFYLALAPELEPYVLAVRGVATLTLQRRHHLRVRDTYTPEAIDRAAVFVPAAQTAETA